jgi:dTDP-4-dehydrorhamnose 3,5-epimerase
MTLHETSIAGLYVMESPVWPDSRGFFREWFKFDELQSAGVTFDVRQANVSFSHRNVVRGLHYSIAPEGQAKAVTCVDGVLHDVIVDTRVGSPTFGAVEIIELRSDQGHVAVLPTGVAHGFSVTSETATLAYLLTSGYSPGQELDINPFDDELGVAWVLEGDPIVSDKDANAPSFAERRDSGQLARY